MFRAKGHHSKDFAKERLNNVLLSERIGCTPSMIQMMKNDIREVISRYLPTGNEEINLRYTQTTHCLQAEITIHNSTESDNHD